MSMPTIKDFRVEANLTVNRLARLADVDFRTAQRADRGEAIQHLKAVAIAKALSKALGRNVSIEEIEDLKISS